MNGRLTLTGTLAILSLVPAMTPAKGALVTWEFAGEVTSVVDTLDLLGGAVTVGSPFSGSYMFDTTTPDIVPGNPGRARYVDLIVALFGQIGDQAFMGPVGSTNQIDIWNGVSDSYIASAEVDLSAQILDFQLSLSAGPATTFSSDALSVAPPDPSVFEHARFLITNESETSPFSVRGDVIWLVPEPAALPLLGLGALLLARCGLRANRRSRSRRTGSRLEGFNSVSSLTFLISAFHLLPTTWACAADCNNNGIDDTCDIECAAPGCSQPCGNSRDCNANSLPDECELAQCPPIDLVFLLDTSQSTDVDLQAVCNEIGDVIDLLTQRGLSVNAERLNIGLVRPPAPSAECPCCTDTVPNVYGITAPGLPEELGDCPNDEGPAEDWGPATAIVAANKSWGQTTRIIVPISDEGPRCGNPVNDPGDDRDAIQNAIPIVLANGVVVMPVVIPSDSGQQVTDAVTLLAQALADGGAPRGQVFDSVDPNLATGEARG